MTITETTVNNLIINKLTQAQYESIASPSSTELYLTPDEPLTSSEIITALGYTPYNSTNPNGYTSNVGTVTDVQINGTSITSNNVANIPIATQNSSNATLGVVKATGSGGIGIDASGNIHTLAASQSAINARTNSYVSIVPSNLNYAVLRGVANNSITMTDTEKYNARYWIGAQEALVSGTNIRTVNGGTLVGSGNLNLAGTGLSVNTTTSTLNIRRTDKANFTIVGSPTITNRVASGFSDNDYLTFDYPFTSTMLRASIFTAFTATDLTIANQGIMDTGVGNTGATRTAFRFSITDQGKLHFRVSTTGSQTYAVDMTGSTTLQANTKYWVQINFVAASHYAMYISTDGINYTLDGSVYNPVRPYYIANNVIAIGDNIATGYSFSGSIDLEETYITMDGVMVWRAYDSVARATDSKYGLVKPDNSTITVNDGVISVGSSFLQNTATGSNALTLLGTATNSDYSINIGYPSSVSGMSSIAIGSDVSVTGQGSIAIGAGSYVAADDAIQIGHGYNPTAHSLSVGFYGYGNYELLGSGGLIPDARISSNIARTSQLPTWTYDSTTENLTIS